jgi:hypothetical protein
MSPVVDCSDDAANAINDTAHLEPKIEMNDDKDERARKRNREYMRQKRADKEFRMAERERDRQRKIQERGRKKSTTETPSKMLIPPIENRMTAMKYNPRESRWGMEIKKCDEGSYEESFQTNADTMRCAELRDELLSGRRATDRGLAHIVYSITLRFDVVRFTLKNHIQYKTPKKALLRLYALTSSALGGDLFVRVYNRTASGLVKEVFASIRNVHEHSWVEVDVTKLLTTHKETAAEVRGVRTVVDERGILTVNIQGPGVSQEASIAKYSSKDNRKYPGPELWVYS